MWSAAHFLEATLSSSCSFSSLLLLVCALVAGWRLLTPSKQIRALGSMPRPSSTVPVIGNTLDLMFKQRDRLHDWIADECVKQNGKPWLLTAVGRPPSVVISSAEAFEDVLQKQFKIFEKGPAGRMIAQDMFGDGIFGADGVQWLRQRKTASHLFSLQMMRDTMELVEVEYTEKLIARLDAIARNNEVVKMKRLLDVFTMDVFTKIGFGVDLNSLPSSENPPFLDAFERASGNLLTRSIEALPLWPLKKKLNIGTERDMADDIKMIDDMVYDIIAQSMNGKRDPDDPVEDLITLFLEKEEVEYANGEKVTTDPKFIRDMALNFVAAGRDTTSQSMSWFLIMTNRNPRVLAKIRTELREKLPGLADGTKRVPTMEDVQHLTYLEAAIRENLRLNPVLAFTSRLALRDTTLVDGTFIKEGTRVVMPHYAMGRLPWVWGDDALEYKPERWIDAETGKLLPVSPFKFSAFLGGPRICLGMKFAFMEMKIAMAALLSKFEITTERDPHTIQYRQTATLSIDGPLNVCVTRLAGVGA